MAPSWLPDAASPYQDKWIELHELRKQYLSTSFIVREVIFGQRCTSSVVCIDYNNILYFVTTDTGVYLKAVTDVPFTYSWIDFVSRCSTYCITKLHFMGNRMTWTLRTSDIMSTSVIGITVDGFAKRCPTDCAAMAVSHSTDEQSLYYHNT